MTDTSKLGAFGFAFRKFGVPALAILAAVVALAYSLVAAVVVFGFIAVFAVVKVLIPALLDRDRMNDLVKTFKN